MAEVIPVINVATWPEVVEKIKLVEPYAKWVKIDVADGTFTPNSLWHNPQDLVGFETPLKIELHLMLSEIDRRIDEWFLANVHRIVFHLEAARDPHLVVEKIKNSGKEVGVGILAETPWEATRPFWGKADTFLFLAVSPGFAGQKMHPGTVEKVRGLREACPECIIEVDGGVNTETAKKAVEAGASILTAASAIFEERDIKSAIENLKP